MRHRMNFKNILLSLIVILALPISFAANAEGNLEVSYDEQQNHQSQLQQKNEMVVMGETQEEKEEHTEQPLTHEQIVSVTDQFMDHLVQDTDQYYNVKAYETMDEFKESFYGFASEEVVDEFVDVYYEIRDGELKVIPTSTPPWFEAGEDYNVQQTEAGTYVVTQETGNELHGNYTIEIEIDLNEDQKPRIMSVNYQG
ncbi:hypothetical protein [Allobacillus halotolerans]|uniref:Uncharacterized protein n=1 Tax=Allobacillus halotolerans TaxID=570278 RepID=A0ABS6GMK8_9BACI|nr:hypothetical protein [Allobacillus halotolerans]MBU6080323.1 hypothetical protein [Allobacillus halotolerans]